MRRARTTATLGVQSGVLSVVLILSSVVTVAACGGSSSTRRASVGPYGRASSPASLSRCMRANGVSGFPDPVAGPGGEGLPLTVSPDGSLTAEGKTFAGPALRSAERICKAYLPPAGGAPPPIRAQQRRQQLAFARCMRAHGVPSFPDPTFSGGARNGLPATINPQSPAFLSAARMCGGGGSGSIAIGS
jgi:hypothetical protein